jgi:hypothetical protein
MEKSMYGMSVGSFVPMLESFVAILDKGAAHAAEQKIDLVKARLAPDMFDLGQQVQIACEHARSGVLRLLGEEPPAFAFAEASLADLQASVAGTIAFLNGVDAAGFDGAAVRVCTLMLPGEMRLAMPGQEFLRAWMLPNFYFHLVTAYDIMRANGVVIGKADYLSQVGAYMRPVG